MIAQMLSREPNERPSFDRILNTYRGSIFPEYFYTFLNDYVTELGELPESTEPEFLQRVSHHSGVKIDRMLEQWDSISVYLEGKGINESKSYPTAVTDPRRPIITPAKHCHVIHPQCSFSKLPPARSAAVSEAMSFHPRGGQS